MSVNADGTQAVIRGGGCKRRARRILPEPASRGNTASMATHPGWNGIRKANRYWRLPEIQRVGKFSR